MATGNRKTGLVVLEKTHPSPATVPDNASPEIEIVKLNERNRQLATMCSRLMAGARSIRSILLGSCLGVIKLEKLFDPSDLHRVSNPLSYSNQR